MVRKGARIVDVLEHPKAMYRSRSELPFRIGERMLARPAHLTKGEPQPWSPSQTNEPVAAIARRTEDGIMSREPVEGVCDIAAPNAGNIAADDDNGAKG